MSAFCAIAYRESEGKPGLYLNFIWRLCTRNKEEEPLVAKSEMVEKWSVAPTGPALAWRPDVLVFSVGRYGRQVGRKLRSGEGLSNRRRSERVKQLWSAGKEWKEISKKSYQKGENPKKRAQIRQKGRPHRRQ